MTRLTGQLDARAISSFRNPWLRRPLAPPRRCVRDITLAREALEVLGEWLFWYYRVLTYEFEDDQSARLKSGKRLPR